MIILHALNHIETFVEDSLHQNKYFPSLSKITMPLFKFLRTYAGVQSDPYNIEVIESDLSNFSDSRSFKAYRVGLHLGSIFLLQ